ncbi:hypothetical protein SKA53_15171 [Yoonia vestfoldensis SKA53]|uniref:Uncharacterized protein n=1 Tax=Yoonia vestfoldensis SKA53 TaxID=314232 RepID=A3V5I2_9RHOB|nr:hypothetical protein SKA53_15171 [Yoonia vestfoldensis SKA53]
MTFPLDYLYAAREQIILMIPMAKE